MKVHVVTNDEDYSIFGVYKSRKAARREADAYFLSEDEYQLTTHGVED